MKDLFLYSQMKGDRAQSQMMTMMMESQKNQMKMMQDSMNAQITMLQRENENKGKGGMNFFGDPEIDGQIKRRLISKALFEGDGAGPTSEGAAILKTLIDTGQFKPLVEQGFSLVQDVIDSRENPNFNPYGKAGEAPGEKKTEGEKKVPKEVTKEDYIAWITKNFPKVPKETATIATDVIMKETENKELSAKEKLQLILKTIRLVNTIRDVCLSLKHYVLSGEKTTLECARWIKKNKTDYFNYIKGNKVTYEVLMTKLKPFKDMSRVKPDWNYLQTAPIKAKVKEILLHIHNDGKEEKKSAAVQTKKENIEAEKKEKVLEISDKEAD